MGAQDGSNVGRSPRRPTASVGFSDSPNSRAADFRIRRICFFCPSVLSVTFPPPADLRCGERSLRFFCHPILFVTFPPSADLRCGELFPNPASPLRFFCPSVLSVTSVVSRFPIRNPLSSVPSTPTPQPSPLSLHGRFPPRPKYAPSSRDSGVCPTLLAANACPSWRAGACAPTRFAASFGRTRAPANTCPAAQRAWRADPNSPSARQPKPNRNSPGRPDFPMLSAPVSHQTIIRRPN